MYLNEAEALLTEALARKGEDPKIDDLVKASYWIGWRNGVTHGLPPVTTFTTVPRDPLNEDDFSAVGE